VILSSGKHGTLYSASFKSFGKFQEHLFDLEQHGFFLQLLKRFIKALKAEVRVIKSKGFLWMDSFQSVVKHFPVLFPPKQVALLQGAQRGIPGHLLQELSQVFDVDSGHERLSQ
jgi:ubiquinone/menaquinone biosynthesis C-methylase UbiE